MTLALAELPIEFELKEQLKRTSVISEWTKLIVNRFFKNSKNELFSVNTRIFYKLLLLLNICRIISESILLMINASSKLV